jgi:hypothetical protein
MWISSSSWLRKDRDGKMILPPAAPRSSQETQNRMVQILEEHGELTGYEAFESVDKWFMLCIWIKHDGLAKVLDKANLERFEKWWKEQATYPDYVRRAREYLVQHDVVGVPPHIKRRMQEKAKAMQSEFAGVRH